MIAYFLLAHRYPDQFKRLFQAIYAPGNQYVVHVDKSSGRKLTRQIAAFLAPYQGVALIESKDAAWGGYSLVDAELRGMARLLEMDANWTHYINLSGQDFPLKSQRYIRQFFAANRGKQYMRTLDQAQVRPDTLNRISHVFQEAEGYMRATATQRPFLANATPYIGTQWKAVTRAFCDYVCHDRRVDRFKAFFAQTFIADESFFQTVLMNSSLVREMVNDDLRQIDWVPDGEIKLRPRTYTTQDFPQLRASPNLFARKFDAQVDETILTQLEGHLYSGAANFYQPPAPVRQARAVAMPKGALVAA